MILFDRANNGLLETNPTQGLGLYYINQVLADFDQLIEFKTFRTVTPQGAELIANSGIFLRAPDPATVDFANQAQFDFYDQTIEVQIDETGKSFFSATSRSIFGGSRFKTGATYGVAAARQWAASVAAPDGGALGNQYWNTYEISARGANVRVTP